MLVRTRSRHSSRSIEPQLTPGERFQRRLEAKRFFLTSAAADWLAKHWTTPRRPSPRAQAHA